MGRDTVNTSTAHVARTGLGSGATARVESRANVLRSDSGSEAEADSVSQASTKTACFQRVRAGAVMAALRPAQGRSHGHTCGPGDDWGCTVWSSRDAAVT